MPSAQTLDDGQYTRDAIRKYEAIYGPDFISPGGQATARAILGAATVAPGALALDVGCGLGGAAFLLARERGARVHGIDLSRNMLALAAERCRAAGLSERVTFEHADILAYVPPAPYDLVHSRDVFLHIHDKPRLFAVLAACLRPGGQLVFSDYLRGDGRPSHEFAAYVAARGYALATAGEYRDLMAGAGLVVLAAEDRTAEFAAILAAELARIPASGLPAHERDELAASWRAKLARAQAGEQRWGVFVARAPGA